MENWHYDIIDGSVPGQRVLRVFKCPCSGIDCRWGHFDRSDNVVKAGQVAFNAISNETIQEIGRSAGLLE